MTVTEENQASGGAFQGSSLQVFTNNLILRLIAKECSVEELKCFRLLNTACYNASQPFWQKNAAVCIGPFYGWRRVSVQEFVGCIEKDDHEDTSILTPFQNFKMLFCTLPPVQPTEEELQTSAEFRFWKVCGGEIKHLHLSHCRFDQKKLVNVICNLARNLESLVIEGIERSYEGGQLQADLLRTQSKLKVLHVAGRLPFPNWRFLKYFPSLEEIKLLDKFTDRNLIADLRDIRREEHGGILNLKSLDVIHTEQSLHGLTEAHLPLEHMSLRLERDVQEDSLRDIMQCQCATLQSLKLFRFPLPHWTPLSSSPLQVSFSSLKELHLRRRVVSSFNFLKWMPSLTTLVVDLLCYSKSSQIYDFSTLRERQPIDRFPGDMVFASNLLLETKDFEHPNLEHFQMDYDFERESFKQLGKWMPNLKAFHGIVCDEMLSMACSQWPKLEHLKLLYGSDVSDQGITGVTLASTVAKEERQPNLTDLNELRSFELEYYCEMSPLSDASGHFAFLRMPRLERLRVCVSPQLTEATEALLKERIPDVQILRNYGENHSKTVPINCCQRVDFYFHNESLKNRSA